jgi:hypothetical protein
MRFALILFVTPTLALAGQPQYSVRLESGSPKIRPGSELTLRIIKDQIEFRSGKTAVLTIPTAEITDLEYGLDSGAARLTAGQAGMAAATLGWSAVIHVTRLKPVFLHINWKNHETVTVNVGLEWQHLLRELRTVTGKTPQKVTL